MVNGTTYGGRSAVYVVVRGASSKEGMYVWWGGPETA